MIRLLAEASASSWAIPLWIAGLVVFPLVWGLATEWVFRLLGTKLKKDSESPGHDHNTYHI